MKIIEQYWLAIGIVIGLLLCLTIMSIIPNDSSHDRIDRAEYLLENSNLILNNPYMIIDSNDSFYELKALYYDMNEYSPHTKRFAMETIDYICDGIVQQNLLTRSLSMDNQDEKNN